MDIGSILLGMLILVLLVVIIVAVVLLRGVFKILFGGIFRLMKLIKR